MRALATAALLAVLAVAAAAQEPSPIPAPAAATPAPAATELLAGTLGTDVDTASFYELVAWCRSLGLPESGSRRELQERLRGHYGLPASAEPVAPGRTVTVRSARSAEYFTIERADESYLVLSGDVVVELRDAEAGATHTIRAGRLTYNQTRRTLSASGGVAYTLEEGGRTESFEGRSLSLDLDTWEAAFTGGKTSKTQSRGGRELTFTFEGESITRLSGDQVVLEEGSFTSCDLDDPHWAIRARKVWILAVGEWALRDAVLTVGRVPVLWMPFFFYPGDRLVFNPAFGYRQREGAFVQTTTYLLGRKAEEESPFSFLKVTETGSEAYEQELRGIFLRKLPTRAPAAPANASTLKLMVDAYSRLGMFAGLEGSFPPSVSFKGGLGFSRSIFEYNGLYTPYYPYDTTTGSIYNVSALFGIPVPFRYGFAADAKASRAAWSGSLHFELLSDPDFSKDFYGRSEGFRLTETLMPAEGAAAASTANLTWEFANRFDLAKLVAVPGISTFSVPYLDGRFTWLSRAQPITEPEPPPSPMRWDPARTFYYPSSITAPRAALTVSGELLRLGGGAAAAAAAPGAGGTPPSVGPDRGFRGPFAEPEAQEPAEEAPTAATGRADLRRPPPRPNAILAPAVPGPSLAVTYQLAPRAELAHTFDAADWTEPSLIDMGILYGTFETAGTGRILVSSSLVGNRLDLALSLGFDTLWRLRFNQSASIPAATWEDYVESDLLQDRFDVTSTLGVTLRPFAEFSPLSGSTMSWQLGMRLLQVRWDKDPFTILDPRFVTTTISPANADMVSTNTLQATVPFRARSASGTFSLSAVLPPLDGALTGRFDASAGIWKAQLQASGNREGCTLDPQPLVIGLSAEPLKNVSLSEELQVSLEGDGVERSTTKLSAGGFKASFVADLAPWASTAGLSYEGETGSLWSWKDRVKIEGGLRTSWRMNFQNLPDNLFDFAPRLTLKVHELLDLTFSSLSVNTKTYRYIPGFSEMVPDPAGWVNPIVDLAKSFNFFNTADRYTSAFKIRSISLKAVHHLHDWDLTVEYAGSPKLFTRPTKRYDWSPTFSVQLQWIPVPELSAKVSGDRDEEAVDQIHVRQ
jgi:hypothetical protein